MDVTTRAFLISVVALSAASASPTGSYLLNFPQSAVVGAAAHPSESRSMNTSVLSKRWDGSPAMGRELQSANGKACNLWATMHLDDAAAGQLFTPVRALAHSDYLLLDGETPQE